VPQIDAKTVNIKAHAFLTPIRSTSNKNSGGEP